MLCVTHNSLHFGDAKDEKPPTFPNPFAKPKLAIASESFGDDFVKRINNKEFNDLERGTGYYRTIQSSGSDVLLLQAIQDVAFSYQPYTCITSKQDAASLPVAIDQVKVQKAFNYRKSDTKVPKSYTLSLFGVTALWHHAYTTVSGRTFNKSDEDVYTWTVPYGKKGMSVELSFVYVQRDQPSSYLDLNLVLDYVQIYDANKTRLLTYNIYSVSTEPSPEDLDMLQLPVGYGCLDKWKKYLWLDLPMDIETKVLSSQNSWFNWEHNTELEVIATEFGASYLTGMTGESCTAIKSMEFVVLSGDDVYIKTGDSDYDRVTKTVTDAKSRVRYTIDLKAGSCKVDRYHNRTAHEPLESLTFVNQMRIDITYDLLEKLFRDNSDFKIVKITGLSKGDSLTIYEERSFEKLFGSHDIKPTRVIKTYTFDAKTSRKQLASIAIWVFNGQRNTIDESYLINVIRKESRLELGVVDVSQDCFFNNGDKAYGRDYAWLRWHYAASKAQLDLINTASDLMRVLFHQTLKKSLGLSAARAPRFELLPDDDGFTARLLVLDSPGLHFVYDEYKYKRTSLGFCEHTSFATDIDHCSKICLDHHCRVFSYSVSTHECNYTSKVLHQSNIDKVLVAADDCSAYILPEGMSLPSIQQRRLHWLINEAGNDIRLGTSSERTSKFWLLMLDANSTLFPDAFEVESDPVREVDLQDQVPDDSFRIGIPIARYHTNDRDLQQQIAMREYTDLNYDQCALLCLDSSVDCGSFSFCSHGKTCTLTNLRDTEQTRRSDLVVEDHDCMIAQRDYLWSFDHLQGTRYPSSYHEQMKTARRNECAERCLFSKDLQCLGFDFCTDTKPAEDADPDDSNELGTCFYQQTRYSAQEQQTGNSTPTESARCDHYSRSLLADFDQLSFRSFTPDALLGVTASRYEGKTLGACADLCGLKTVDCVGLQFCVEQTAENTLTQTCTIVEGSVACLTGAVNASQAPTDNGGAVESMLEGLLKADTNCRVLMHKDRSRNSLEPPEAIDESDSQAGGDPAGGLSITGALLLFLILTATMAAITFGLYWAEERSLVIRRCLSCPRSLIGHSRR